MVSACTGPNGGLTQQDLHGESLSRTSTPIAGSTNWDNPTNIAYGTSSSFYEEDKTKQQTETIDGVTQNQPYIVGSPIADVYAVAVRENSAILAIADGSSWGKKPRLAARCAVRAAVEYVTEKLDSISDTHSLVNVLDEAVEAAHQRILDHSASLTTLSVAVACEMANNIKDEWGLVVVSVGDSPVYVYCPHTRTIIEATVGSHSENGDRNVRLSGGAIGPAIGSLPDLENLSVSYMPVYPGDIVIAVTDGISDNFSSTTMQSPGEMSPDARHSSPTGSPTPSSPTASENPPVFCHTVQGHLPTCSMKCCASAKELTKLLQQHQYELSSNMSAQTVATCIMNHTASVTEEKRRFRSNCLEKGICVSRRCREDPEFAQTVKSLHGKLDHATVVTYQVNPH